MKLEHVDLDVVLQEIVDVAGVQEAKYGPFTAELADVRLGIAALEDELREAREAWRDERRIEGWPHTREELVQVASLAFRLAAAL